MDYTIEKEKQASVELVLAKYKLPSLDKIDAKLQQIGINTEEIVHNIQPIAFDNAIQACILGLGIALVKKAKTAQQVALCLGEGLQAFCTPGTVAHSRQIGLGHGKLASMLLDEKIKSFAFLAGHESFAASEGAISMALNANKVRKNKINVCLIGLGKDAAHIIARINGFTYVETNFDHKTGKLLITGKKAFSNSERSNIKIYGAFDAEEGLAIMKLENIDISITGNSTNPVRFTHLVAGMYKKYCTENNLPYFSVASGGGTGRTLHPDNMGAGPASYGLTDSMARMHSDAQFAGSSSVPAHVNMMGFVGIGNNPLVGTTVALSVKFALAINKWFNFSFTLKNKIAR